MHRESDDEDYYYAHDHLYSVVVLLDDSGNVVERYEYDAYGTVHIMDASHNSRTTSTYGNPYFFTGRRLDVLDNGNKDIYYYRERYYGPHVARFYQQDPFGYVDGMNLYQYVKSRPLTYLDSLGLSGDGCPNCGGGDVYCGCEALNDLPKPGSLKCERCDKIGEKIQVVIGSKILPYGNDPEMDDVLDAWLGWPSFITSIISNPTAPHAWFCDAAITQTIADYVQGWPTRPVFSGWLKYEEYECKKNQFCFKEWWCGWRPRWVKIREAYYSCEGLENDQFWLPGDTPATTLGNAYRVEDLKTAIGQCLYRFWDETAAESDCTSIP